MNVVIDISGDKIVLIPLKNGKIESIYPMSAFEARLLAQKLIDKAEELENGES